MDYQVHNVSFDDRTTATIPNLYQWDIGQVIKFSDSFPAGTEAQFADGSIKVIVNNQITIPDTLLQEPGWQNCWVQVIGDDNDTTVYTVKMRILARAQKGDYVEPTAQNTFRQDIQALVNSAVSAAEDAQDTADDALAAAQQAEALAGNLNQKIAHVDAVASAVDSAKEAAETSETNAKSSEDKAKEYAEAAEQSMNQAGYIFFDINDSGHLIETRSTGNNITFQLNNTTGHLEVVV